MRAKEFLLEYERDRTIQALGEPLWLAGTRDIMGKWNINLHNFKKYLIDFAIHNKKIEKFLSLPEEQLKISDNVLQQIETADPTHNKKYTQWLARQFASGTVPKLEDILSTAKDYLVKFDKLNRKRMLKPPFNDINRFKTIDDFMNAMDQYELPEDELKDRGKFNQIYSNNDVRIIHPIDEAAACFWGRGTRWCTAATQGSNYFDDYNRQGPLYILLPKTPKYKGEKYQLHFSSGQYMNELDKAVEPYKLLTMRFPDLLDWFKTQPDVESEINDLILFASDDLLERLILECYNATAETIMTFFTNWESADDTYLDWLEAEGYTNEEGSIDWDKAPPYTEYNDEAGKWLTNIEDAMKLSPYELRDFVAKEISTEYNVPKLRELPDCIGWYVKNSVDTYGKQIKDWMITHLMVTGNNSDNYEVTKITPATKNK